MRYWARQDIKGKITTVESYSHDLNVDEAVEITKRQYDEFIVSLPVFEPEPVRDLAAEIDGLKAEIEKLKAR